MFTTQTLPEKQTYPKLADLRGSVESAWRAALMHLGLIRIGEDSSGYKGASLTDEIDSIMSYVKMMAFFNSSSDDIVNRQRFLADYVGRHFTPESISRLQLASDSFVRRVVRNIALVYKWGATRWVNDGDDKYQELLAGSTIARASKAWNRMYTLTDYAAVMPTVREMPWGKEMDFSIIGADESRVKLDAQGNMTAFAYYAPLFDDEGTQLENVVYVWTKDQYYYISANGDMGTVGEDSSNPYGEIPVTIFTGNPRNPYDNGGRMGLVDSNLHANYLKTLGLEDVVFAAIGVWFGTNIGEKGATIIGPDKPIWAEMERPDLPTPSLEYVKGEPHAQLINELKWSEEKRGMLNEGMSPALLVQEATELSGVALRNLARETMEQREDDTEVMIDCEKDLYRKMVIVANRDMGYNLNDKPSNFNIALDDPQYIDDQAAEYALDKEKVADYVMGIDEFLRKWDSDVENEAEALARITDRKRMLAQVNQKRGAIVDALQARLTTGGADGPATA